MKFMQHCLLNINVFGYKQRTATPLLELQLLYICICRGIFHLDHLKEYSLFINCRCRTVLDAFLFCFIVFFFWRQLTGKVKLWLYIAARYMTIMLNLHRGTVSVEFECPCCGLPSDDRTNAFYNRMLYDRIGLRWQKCMVDILNVSR